MCVCLICEFEVDGSQVCKSVQVGLAGLWCVECATLPTQIPLAGCPL